MEFKATFFPVYHILSPYLQLHNAFNANLKLKSLEKVIKMDLTPTICKAMGFI